MTETAAESAPIDAPPGEGSREERFANLTLVRHPLVRHKVDLLRDVGTPAKLFKELVDEIAMLMAYEVTADLPTREREIRTPMEPATGRRVDGESLVLVPILRAGLGMVEGVMRLIPTVRVGHIGLQREHDSLEPIDYYFKIPSRPEERRFIVTDPMLATGGSASAAIGFLKKSGAVRIRLMCIVTAPEGVRRLEEEHPDVPLYAAALDRELNEDGYILPGLGDAGDRLFGTE